MGRQADIKIFTEELWQNIMWMTAGSELTSGDVLQAVDTIRARLAQLATAEGGTAGGANQASGPVTGGPVTGGSIGAS